MKQRRIDLDLVKGIGIVLMVIGHMHINEDIVNKWIYAFHMPLFFLVSGILFSGKKDIRSTLTGKCKALLVPYLFFGGGYVLLNIAQELLVRRNTASIPEGLYQFFLVQTTEFPFESAMWFLPAMFVTAVGYELLDRLLKNKAVVLSAVVIVFGIAGFLYPQFVSFRLPWGLDVAMPAILFYHTGVCLSRYSLIDRTAQTFRKMPQAVSVLFFVICAGVNTVCIFLNQRINMRAMEWGIIPLTFFNAVTAVVLLLLLARQIAETKLKDTKAVRILCRISEMSIIFVCINHLTLRVFSLCVSKATALLPFQAVYLNHLIVFVLSMALMYAVSCLITKTKLRILIGKSIRQTAALAGIDMKPAGKPAAE